MIDVSAESLGSRSQVHLTKLELLKMSFTDLNPQCISQLSRLQNLQSLHLDRDAGEAVHGPPSVDQSNALWQACFTRHWIKKEQTCGMFACISTASLIVLTLLGLQAQAIGTLQRLTSLRVCSLDLEFEESCDMGRRAIPLWQLSNLR